LDVIGNAKIKVKEADYFYLMMLRICASHESILKNIPARIITNGKEDALPEIELEVSYIFSAFLNACYGVIGFLMQDGRTKELAANFKNANKSFYGSGKTGGYRTRTAHFHQVLPKYIGWKEPIVSEQENKFWDALEEEEGECEVEEFTIENMPEFLKRKIYLENFEPQKSIDCVCGDHLFEIWNLVGEANRLTNG
jgi:hypothetical protein